MTKLSLNDNTCCKKSRLIIRLLEDSDEQIKQQNIGHQQKQRHDDSHQCATKFIMTGGVESCGFLIYKEKNVRKSGINPHQESILKDECCLSLIHAFTNVHSYLCA